MASSVARPAIRFATLRHPTRVTTTVVRSRVETLAGVAIVYVACFAVLGSTPRAMIGAAVAIDLTVTASFVVWWLGVRRGAVGWWAVTMTAGAGIALVRAVVPEAPWPFVVVGSIAIEATVLAFVALRAKVVIRAARAMRGRGPIVALEAGLRAARLPALFASFAATELGTFWLALTGWFRRPAANAFSMHRRSSWFAICAVFVLLIAGETAVLHVLVAMWSSTAAWIATALSIYSVLWLVGDAQALRLFAIVVDATHVHVTVGFRRRASLPRAAIEAIERTTIVPDGAVALTMFEPTLIVTLREPVTVRGMFGRSRAATRIALSVDDPEALVCAISTPDRTERGAP